MESVLEFLKGKKTYFVAAGLGVIVMLQSLGVIGEDMATMMGGLLGAGGLATLRAGVSGSSSE